MTWRVGMKAVCVDLRLWPGEPPPYPTLGAVYTVSNVFEAFEGCLHLELLELPSPQTDGWFAGFDAQCFRPVVEREYDISIFTEMLDAQRIQLPDLVDDKAPAGSVKRFAETVGVLCAGWLLCFGIALSDFLMGQ